MKKSFRVKKDREFQKVFHKGKSTANRQFVIYKYNKEDQSHFRVGISVSKKLGNAVKRNRAKRRLRALFCEYSNSLKDGTYIFVAKAAIFDAPFEKLTHDFNKILTRAKTFT